MAAAIEHARDGLARPDDHDLLRDGRWGVLIRLPIADVTPSLGRSSVVGRPALALRRCARDERPTSSSAPCGEASSRASFPSPRPTSGAEATRSIMRDDGLRSAPRGRRARQDHRARPVDPALHRAAALAPREGRPRRGPRHRPRAPRVRGDPSWTGASATRSTRARPAASISTASTCGACCHESNVVLDTADFDRWRKAGRRDLIDKAYIKRSNGKDAALPRRRPVPQPRRGQQVRDLPDPPGQLLRLRGGQRGPASPRARRR